MNQVLNESHIFLLNELLKDSGSKRELNDLYADSDYTYLGDIEGRTEIKTFHCFCLPLL